MKDRIVSRRDVEEVLGILRRICDSGRFSFDFDQPPAPEEVDALQSPHQHDFHEIKLVERSHPEGQSFYLLRVEPAGVIHGAWNQPGAYLLTLNLMPDSVFTVVDGVLGILSHYDERACSAAAALFHLLAAAVEYRRCGLEERAEKELHRSVLAGLIRLFELAPAEVRNRTGVFHSARLFMLNNFSSPALCGADIARAASRSLQSLNAIFNREAGESVWQFLIRLRLERAELLLRTSNCSIDEIVLGCGWRSRSYFTKAFHRRYGVSPARYRQQQRRS